MGDRPSTLETVSVLTAAAGCAGAVVATAGAGAAPPPPVPEALSTVWSEPHAARAATTPRPMIAGRTERSFMAVLPGSGRGGSLVAPRGERPSECGVRAFVTDTTPGSGRFDEGRNFLPAGSRLGGMGPDGTRLVWQTGTGRTRVVHLSDRAEADAPARQVRATGNRSWPWPTHRC